MKNFETAAETSALYVLILAFRLLPPTLWRFEAHASFHLPALLYSFPGMLVLVPEATFPLSADRGPTEWLNVGACANV